MKKFDCIIIGAGPAGIAASKIFEKNNINYCLIDKNKFPREKLCGGGLTNKSVNLLKKLELDYQKIDVNEVKNVLVVSKKISKNVELNNSIKMVNRKEFDYNNLKNLKNKNIFLNEKIIEIKDNILKTDKNEYEFNYIIFADGVNGFSRNLIKNRQLGFCVEYTIPNTSKETILDFEAINQGYGWIFPKKNSTTIGLGNINLERYDYIKVLDDFAKKYNFLIDKTKIKGYHIPIFSKEIYQNSIVNDKYILVGDAASLVDPISGEGIYYALFSGMSAAETIIDALNGKNLKETYFSKTKNLCLSLEKRKRASKIIYSKMGSSFIKMGLKNAKLLEKVKRVFG